MSAGLRDATAVTVDGLKIAYESAGVGDPPVVFIHGFGEDRTYFAPQIEHLEKGRRVVALDLRGHGDSSVPETVAVHDFATDVVAVCDDAGIEGAVLCGHSMGVALLVASLRPEIVRGIVMVDGAILFPEPVRRQGLEGLVPALKTDHWLDTLRAYFARTLDPRDPSDVGARVMADLGRISPSIASSFFSSVFASDWADELAAVRCPVLYIHAKAPTDLARLEQLRPDALIGQVIASGHYAMLSAPEQVKAMLDRFLGMLTAETP